MEEIINDTQILDEHYEVEFVEDPACVYGPGEYADATDFIDAYCECNSPELDDVSNWLHSISIPEAVKFVAKAWCISYKLHKITQTDSIIE